MSANFFLHSCNSVLSTGITICIQTNYYYQTCRAGRKPASFNWWSLGTGWRKRDPVDSQFKENVNWISFTYFCNLWYNTVRMEDFQSLRASISDSVNRHHLPLSIRSKKWGIAKINFIVELNRYCTKENWNLLKVVERTTRHDTNGDGRH